MEGTTKAQKINAFNEINSPFYLVDHGNKVSLCCVFHPNFKQISQLSFHRLANGDKSWYSRLFRHLSYREKLRITLHPSAQLSVQK